MRCTLFPIYDFHFSHAGFLVSLEGFNEATSCMIQTHMVMASKGECYKSLSGWPITNDQDKAQAMAKGGEREAVILGERDGRFRPS